MRRDRRAAGPGTAADLRRVACTPLRLRPLGPAPGRLRLCTPSGGGPGGGPPAARALGWPRLVRGGAGRGRLAERVREERVRTRVRCVRVSAWKRKGTRCKRNAGSALTATQRSLPPVPPTHYFYVGAPLSRISFFRFSPSASFSLSTLPLSRIRFCTLCLVLSVRLNLSESLSLSLRVSLSLLSLSPFSLFSLLTLSVSVSALFLSLPPFSCLVFAIDAVNSLRSRHPLSLPVPLSAQRSFARPAASYRDAPLPGPTRMDSPVAPDSDRCARCARCRWCAGRARLG